MREPEYGSGWMEGFRRFGDRLVEVLMELETIEERKAMLDNVVQGVTDRMIAAANDREGAGNGWVREGNM